MKTGNVVLLTSSLILLIVIILLCTWPKEKSKEKFVSMDANAPFNTCYATQMACMNDCAPVYTFIPNASNKWIFYNGSLDDSRPPTLSFTRYPNNVVEVSSSALNTINKCRGDGWLYMNLSDGVWKEQQREMTGPPEFISSLVVDKPENNVQPSTRPELKTSGEFPIIVSHNNKEIAIAGIAKFKGENGSASPLYNTCCPALFLYIIPNGKTWFGFGGGTDMTIPPFVGRYQSGA